MYELETHHGELTEKELRKALRKHLNPYQLKQQGRFTAGRDHWMWNAGGGRRDFLVKQLEGIAREFGVPANVVDILLNHAPVGPQMDAKLLDGRWVVSCECGGQEVVDPDDPAFVCLNPNCLNVLTKHEPRKVKFPKGQKLKGISEVLLARPNPINRNWLGETIAVLEKENTDHGLPKRVTVKEQTHGMVNTNK
jgi:hypothetical protein